jgi:putative transcriptional regulator
LGYPRACSSGTGRREMDTDQLRNDIRRHRFERNEMTQQELADAVGCSRQTIVMLEKERYSPSLTLAMKIARFFDVKVDNLFWLDGDVDT